MNEWILVWLVPMRLFAVLVFSTLYVIGGREHKWIRRFIAPLFFVGILALVSYFVQSQYWRLAPLAGLPIVLSLGYTDKDGFGFGWARRLIYGTLFGGIGLAMGFMYGLWYIGLWQMLMAILASMILGLLNPLEAVNEEALISTLSVMFIPFMIRMVN